MSEKMLETLNQILAAQVLTLHALADIELILRERHEGEQKHEGSAPEPQTLESHS